MWVEGLNIHIGWVGGFGASEGFSIGVIGV